MTEALGELGNQNLDDAALTQVAKSESQALSITFTAADSQNLQTEQYLDTPITKAMSNQPGTAPQMVLENELRIGEVEVYTSDNRVNQMINEWVKITGEKLSDSDRQCLKMVLESEPNIDLDRLRFVLYGWRLRGEHDLTELRNVASAAQERINMGITNQNSLLKQFEELLGGFKVAIEKLLVPPVSQPSVIPVSTMPGTLRYPIKTIVQPQQCYSLFSGV